MFESLKASAKAGADATARSAKTAKLKGEVMMLEQKMQGMKKDFGKDVYDAMVAGDKVNTERLFNETRAKIEVVQTEITAKKAEIEGMRHARPGSAAVGSTPAQETPPSEVPTVMGVPALPEGWKTATTPDGKSYYYHEPTGETSWQLPQ